MSERDDDAGQERQPSGREPSGREPSGREPSGREPAGRESAARDETSAAAEVRRASGAPEAAQTTDAAVGRAPIDPALATSEGQVVTGRRRSDWPTTLREISTKGWLVTVLAMVAALVVGSILIIVSSPRVAETSSYFFTRPWDTIYASIDAVYGAYRAMFRGAIFDFEGATWVARLQPLSNTLVNSVPLILAGLGLAIGFRSGLFNIGGQGQVILGAITATYIGFAWDLPPFVHLLVAILGGAIGGMLWASIAGVLKARTGANEVIVTIMLNSIAGFLVLYVLKSTVFGGERPNGQTSFRVDPGATYPLLLGSDFRLHAGLILAILAAIFTWWFLERSTWGFELRAVGANPDAARTAGISVPKATIVAMAVSGALCGLAGTAPVLGTEKYLSLGVAGTYGFDAITVALLGRSRPWGTFFAGLLFGALKAGGTLMSTTTRTPLDGAPASMPIEFILVLQSVIVLFIAAPPLVRWIFRLPDPQRRPRRRTKRQDPSTSAAAPATSQPEMS